MEYSTSPRPSFPAPRRVATAPIPLSSQFASPPSEGLVETLYNHPNAKIVSFNASGRAFSRSLGRNSALPDDDEAGTLSWSSQLERTIAVGPFRIYRAPGSVAFLNCGSALQPILPKSQCWCIDEMNSKFILQIRRPTYWRIELPVSDPEDQVLAQSLRGVFDKILQFEKTECPFKRSFTVILPERPQTPVIKKPWTPVRRSLPASPAEEPVSPASRPSSTTRRPRGSTLIDEWSEASTSQWDESTAAKTLKTRASSPRLGAGALSLTEISSRKKRDENYFDQSPTTEGSFNQRFPLTESLNVLSEVSHDSPELHKARNTPPEPKRVEHIYQDPFKSESIPEADFEPPELETEDGLEEEHSSPSVTAVSPPQKAAPIEDDVLVYELHEGSGDQGNGMKTRLRRKFASTRSLTSPALMQLFRTSSPSSDQTQPSKQSEPSQAVSSTGSDAHSRTLSPMRVEEPSKCAKVDTDEEPHLPRRGSEDSFHSVQSWHSPTPPLPPSPPTSQPESPATFPYPHENIVLPKRTAQEGKPLDTTSRPELGSAWDVASNEESEASQESVATAPDGSIVNSINTYPSSAVSEGDGGTSATPIPSHRPATSHRATTSSISVRRRALSPLPSPANLFSPTPTPERRNPYRSKLETVKKLPLTIIAKTCEMIMGPPNHLITLMLKVAAKIAAGEWRGLVYGYNDRGEQIPVQWDYSEGDFSDWSEEEPYMGLHRRHAPPKTEDEPNAEGAEASSDDSRSWGVD
ncbi:hypothetical protein G7046_g375 [Stylonectria norvegica]|nr:hypothetical protein G7046_g375 [Stylonectria norvegica]